MKQRSKDKAFMTKLDSVFSYINKLNEEELAIKLDRDKKKELARMQKLVQDEIKQKMKLLM